MKRALVLGGTGALGLATAHRMLAAGWSVDVTGRNPAKMPASLLRAGARFIASDRYDPAQLAEAIGDGADLLVDAACYTAAHARSLLPFLADVDSSVMLSSKAVYVDGAGNHVNSEVAPVFPAPIQETNPTMAPGHGTYQSREGYGANKVAAEHLLLDSGAPVSIIRASRSTAPEHPTRANGCSSSASSTAGPRSSWPTPAAGPTTPPPRPTPPRSSRSSRHTPAPGS